MTKDLSAIARQERRRQRIAVGGIGAIVAIACLLPHSERALLSADRPAAAFAAMASPDRVGPGGWRAAPTPRLAALRTGSSLPAVTASEYARAFPATAVDYAATDEPVAAPMSDASALPLAALASAPAAAGYFPIVPTPGGDAALLGRGGFVTGGGAGGGGVGGGGGGGGTTEGGDGATVTPRPGGDTIDTNMPAGGGDDIVPPPPVAAEDPATPPHGGGEVAIPRPTEPTLSRDPAIPTAHDPVAPNPPAPVPPVVANVPEPATWALLLLGFGGIAAALRRRHRAAAPAG